MRVTLKSPMPTQATGQITVKEDTKLDYESKKKTYMVTVTATDPSRASTTIDVTINVTDVNEGPEFTAPKEGDVDVTVKENTRSLNIYSFRATDPERRTVYWSLDSNSPDASSFTISDRGVLSLNASPDYEDEGLGDDKIAYTVIVVASDDAPGAGIGATEEDPIKTSTKTVTVTVEDVEETGAITTSPKNPHVGDARDGYLDRRRRGAIITITWEWTAGRVERRRPILSHLIHPGGWRCSARRCGEGQLHGRRRRRGGSPESPRERVRGGAGPR